MSRSARASQSLVEIAGQCTKCFDFFTVELMPLDGKIGKPHMRYYRPMLTARLAYKKHMIYHRPKRAGQALSCGGAVKLFGIPRIATFS